MKDFIINVIHTKEMAQQPQPVGIFLIPQDSIVVKSIYITESIKS